MSTLLQVLFSGATMGCVYAFVALGFTLTIAAAGVVNFAYSEWVTYGAYLGVTFAVILGWPLWLALTATIAACVLIGCLFQLFIFTPLEGRHFLTTVSATIGIALAMQALATLVWGPYPLTLPTFFGAGAVQVGSIALFPHNLLIIALAIVIIGGLQLAMTRTSLGLKLQATAQDSNAARLMGIRVRRMRALAYCLSAGIAGLSGFLVAPLFVVTNTMGFGLMLKGFAATIVGGWGSLKGAVFGGLLVGLIEAIGAAYLSSEYKETIAFAMIVLVLLVRPKGLFPERIAEKL
ncbi:branched-chain amino acid ABC transporter permease [Terrarubrum flagellatum]|uniref:branched-chain amino acid ABC transporter permease n=1 Tax=Terrirubrum flagellatum TaxID=2895980 RepID=UPI003144FB09